MTQNFWTTERQGRSGSGGAEIQLACPPQETSSHGAVCTVCLSHRSLHLLTVFGLSLLCFGLSLLSTFPSLTPES